MKKVPFVLVELTRGNLLKAEAEALVNTVNHAPRSRPRPLTASGLAGACADLRGAAVHEEFDVVDKAAVVRRKKQDGFGAFIGRPGPTQRSGRGGLCGESNISIKNLRAESDRYWLTITLTVLTTPWDHFPSRMAKNIQHQVSSIQYQGFDLVSEGSSKVPQSYSKLKYFPRHT